MKKMEAFFDWFILITSPGLVAAVWLTEDTKYLRILAFLWLIGTILSAIGDRLEAHLARAQGED